MRVRVSGEFKQLFVRNLQWTAEAEGVSFDEVLRRVSQAKLSESLKGKILTSTTAGGATSTFTLPPVGSITQDDIATICAQVLSLVDEIRECEPEIGDKQLVAKLIGYLKPITSFAKDFRGYRA